MKKSFWVGIVAAALAVTAFAGGSSSGLKPGESVTPFHPKHLAGPLAGTTNCFPCTFQNRPQVQIWVNGDSPENVAKLAKALDDAMGKYQGKEFKALVVILTDGNDSKAADMVKGLVKDKGLNRVGIALGDKNAEFVKDYKINIGKEIKNTVITYKNWTVAKNIVNLSTDATGLGALHAAIAEVVK